VNVRVHARRTILLVSRACAPGLRFAGKFVTGEFCLSLACTLVLCCDALGWVSLSLFIAPSGLGVSCARGSHAGEEIHEKVACRGVARSSSLEASVSRSRAMPRVTPPLDARSMTATFQPCLRRLPACAWCDGWLWIGNDEQQDTHGPCL